ncbi:MAG: four helix bundle protein [Deltaproteobacteria bacterium]|nr:four helix bundle protein [Deltaproteobacteria bacterium]
MKSYRDLLVWQKAMGFVALCYRASDKLPTGEEYGLKSQIRRAAVSIPTNIAEGHERGNPRELARFLGYSKGSLAEVETLSLLALEFGFIAQDGVDDILERASEIGKMVNGLVRSTGVKTATAR